MDDVDVTERNDAQKKQKAEKWKSCPAEEYAAVASALLHFSSKTVNSNTRLAGVRLAEEKAWDAPMFPRVRSCPEGCAFRWITGKAGQKPLVFTSRYAWC